MPKELFFQGDPVDVLDDLDRVAFGQPGVPGAKNVLWSKLKELVSSGVTFIGLGDTPDTYLGQDGKKVIVDEATGKLIFAPSTTSSGFYDPDNITITFDGTTLVLTGTNKFVTSNGSEYEKTDDSIVIVPVNGLMYVYYDNDGKLQQLNNPNRSTQFDQMRITLPVAYTTYNLAATLYTFVGNYLKGRSSTKLWVKNFYDNEVATLTGLTVFGLTGGGGSDNADVQLGLSAGELIFTDNHYLIPTRAATDTWNVGYFDASLDPVGLVANPYLVITDADLGIDTTGRALYNNGGNPLPVSSGNYVWYFILQSVDIKDTDRTLAFMGEGEYGNLSTAEDALPNEVATLEGRLVIRQGASVKYAVLIESKSTFSNATKSRIEEVVQVQKEGGGTPTVSIPDDLINGSDASALHNHDSLYVRLDSPDRVQRIEPTLSVLAGTPNTITLDWGGKNDLVAENELNVTAPATILFANDANARFADFVLNITNLAAITFPSGIISPDDNVNTLIWTPPENGIYSFGLRRVGSTYILLVTQKGAV